MSVFTGAKNSIRLLVGLAAATASTSAFAGRYWQGANTLFSNTSNWGTGSGSGAPASVPGTSGESNSEGTTYFYGYKNGVCNIDGAFTLYDKLCVATDSTSYFNWNASPLSGITATGKDFQFGSDVNRSPTYLRITGGIYTFGTTRIGNTASVCGLEFNGDTFNAASLRVGNANGANGTLTINSGLFQVTGTGDDKVFGLAPTKGTTGTLIMNGGTLSVQKGGYVCSLDTDTVTGSTGTMILNGGTFDMSGTLKIGSWADSTANIFVNTGAVCNLGGFRLGGRANGGAYNVANSVARMEVNGGTLNLGSTVSGIGYCTGEGSYAEMIVNDGVVNITGTDAFYVGESGPGYFTLNGGTFSMPNAANGFGFGHKQNGKDVGTVTLNGGVLNIYAFRLKYLQEGSRLICNGGTIKAVASNTGFLNADTKLTCIIDEGGLIIDTAGFDITIAHPFVSAAGKPIGGITKKGLGTLTLSQTFSGTITVQKGEVVANGTTYVPTGGTSEQSRYWLGAKADALVSDTDNWSETSGGTGGASAPDDEFLGEVFFDGTHAHDTAVFDASIDLAAPLYIGAATATPLTWRANDPSYGFLLTSTDWLLGYNPDHTAADLQIDGGTYQGKNFRLGYTENAVANVLLNDGTMTVANGRVAGDYDGSTATLALSNGTFTASSSLYIVSGGKGGMDGKLVVDGGTLVSTAFDYAYIGRDGTNSTALLHMKRGTWNTKAFIIGGPTKQQTNDFPRLIARLVVDGGTINASADCVIGSNVGEGSRSEMIVNGGAVNINYNNLYVGNGGPGYLTINGGSVTMKDTDYGICISRLKNDGTGVDPGHVTLNGGTLTLPRFRLDYTAPGSTIVFNGGTIKATRSNENFLAANTNVTVEIQSGNLIVDTDGHNIIIAHDLTGPGGIVKRGKGALYLTGNNTFAGNIIVEQGTVGNEAVTVDPADYTTTYTVAADGEDLGVVQLHRSPLSYWLLDELASYEETYEAKGTASLETPRYIAVSANGETKTYMNLNTGTVYNDTVGGLNYTFTTEDAAPRTLRIDFPTAGKYAKNVRDVGSWPLQSLNGKKMNQDVIFRGAHLDNMADATAAQRTASYLTAIGLKSEIDLRRLSQDTDMADAYKALAADGSDASFAADGCSYFRFDMTSTQIDAGDSGAFTNRIQKMFSTLGTPGRLPAYFHCKIGTDRTGITGLLLLGLMGVEEEVLYRDYLMSNFASIGGSRSLEVPETFLRYIHRGWCRNGGEYVYNTKDDQYGISVASRCRQYLEMCGVTQAELENITMALSGETLQQVLDRVNAYEQDKGYRTVTYVDYEGADATSATMHRFGTDGMRILPRKEPTRSGYIFLGWDVDNEVETGTGQVDVYGLWKLDVPEPTFRFWADGNSGHEEFASVTSWDPVPKNMTSVYLDTFVLNKGIDKIAELTGGVSCSRVYVGWGTKDGSTMSTDDDLGGRLDVAGGTLTATNGVWVGGSYSDYHDNVMNLTNGTVYARWLRMADSPLKGEKTGDTINISGTGHFEVEADGSESRLTTSANGLSRMNVLDGGSFRSAYRLYVGYSGKAFLEVDGGTIELTNTGDDGTLYVGREGTSAFGSMHVTNGTVSAYSLRIGQSAGSTGEVTIDEGSTVNCSHGLYVGRKGTGTFTLNGGEVNVAQMVRFSTDAAGIPGCVINLNGGCLKAVEFTSANVLGIINWNGGTISGVYNADYDMSGVLFPAADAARFDIRVLAGNAIYESSDDGVTYQINVPMAGPGAFVKRGAGALVINGTTDVRGGIRAEGGSLTFGTGALVGDPMKPMKELTVFSGGELDLGGASISVMKYVAYGVEQPVGTYTEHGGTITVLPASFYEPATAVWTNYLGDGDLDNPDNWTVKNAEGVELPGALPDANTTVYIPANAVRPDVSGLTIKCSTLLVSSDTYLRGRCKAPAVAKQAACWFDFDDEKTITFREGSSTEIASIANKGTAASTLASAVAYGNEPDPDGDGNPTYREPRLGSNELNGRTIMLQTDLDDDGGVSAKGFRTEALGLEGNHDRTLVVVSRRGTSTPLWALGIETGDDSMGHFRIQRSETSVPYKFCAGNYDGTGNLTGYGNHDIECGQDPEGWSVRMFEAENTNPDTGEVRVSTRTRSEESDVETSNSLTVRNLNTQADARLYMGYRLSTQSNGRGQIAEALYFDRALTVAEQKDLQDYLAAKWFTAADMSNIPGNIALENNATIDFGGGYWTFGTVTGAGTIGNANVVITDSIQPGLTVGGTVTFAENAGFDMSPYEMGATGQQIVFLTAEKIENAPERAKGESRIAHLALVDNGDGTVSLVGVLQSAGFSFKLR